MPINIPQIKRAEPVSQGSIGRDQTQAPSIEPQLKNLNTVSNVFEKGADLAFKYEAQAQDTELRDLTNKYKAALYGTGDEKEEWTVTRFQNTPKEGQDLTPAFAGYKSYKQSLRDKVLGEARGGVADRLKTELADVDFYADRTVNVEFYKANNIRQQDTHKTEIENLRNKDLPSAVAYYNPKDPETVEQLLKVINKAGLSTASLLLKSGVSYDDSVMNSKVDEQRGILASDAANYAILTRDVEKAQAILNDPNYKGIIPAERVKNVVSQIENVKEERQINQIVDQNMQFTEAVGMDNINKMKELTPEKRDTAIKEFISKKTKIRESRLRDSATAANAISLYAQQLSSTGQLPATYEQFSKDPKVASLLPFVTEGSHLLRAKAALNIYPKDSDIQVYKKVDQAFASGEAYRWDEQRLNNELVGLSKSDTNHYVRQYVKKDKIGLQTKQRIAMEKSIKTYLRPGEWAASTQTIWNNYFRYELEKRFDNLDADLTTQQREEYLQKWKPELKKAYDAIRSADREDRDAVAKQYFDMSLSESDIKQSLPTKKVSAPKKQRTDDVDPALQNMMKQLER